MSKAGDQPDESEDGNLVDESWDSTYHHSPFVRELRRLKALGDYQRRGYEFQDFVASLFKQRHYRVALNPGTARPRQTDLLAIRGSDVYLIETKWRKSKANIDDVDSLFARLAAAPANVVGLMVSYSGFTAGAIERVEERSDRPVLLLTGIELEQLVERDDNLPNLLVQKKTFLLTHRKASFAAARGHRDTVSSGGLAVAPASFVLLDGSRAQWIACRGGFGEFTFAQELPDIDWVPGEGRGVALDMPVTIYDQNGVLDLLTHLSGMGWSTDYARWSIQQSFTNWHGLGASAFAEALQGWQMRYKGIETHHSEEFCYFDKCEGGFYCLTAKISAHKSRWATHSMLSFHLSGIPFDTDPFKELYRTFDVGQPCYFRPLKRRSVKSRMNLAKEYRLPLKPVAFVVEKDSVFGDEQDWVRGLVAKNPFYRSESTLAERKPRWLHPYIFDSELLICDLRSWHPLAEPKPGYELWGFESARTADAVVIRPVAEWPDRDEGPTEEIAPRILAPMTEEVEVVHVE
jgi:hypothetical protein